MRQFPCGARHISLAFRWQRFNDFSMTAPICKNIFWHQLFPAPELAAATPLRA